MAEKRVKFNLSTEHYDRVSVMVDGVEVGTVKKRVESYTGIQRGGTYTYFDFYPKGERERTASADRRRVSVAEGLVKLGMVEAAMTVDADTAKHYATRYGTEA